MRPGASSISMSWIVAFCDAEGLSYDTPLRAKVALPGGGEVHWT